MFKTIELSYNRAAELDEGYIVFTTNTSNFKEKDIPLNANPRKPTRANKNVKLMIEQLEIDPKNFRKKNEGNIGVGELLQVANIISPGRKTIENAKHSYNSKGAILNSLKNNKLNAPIVKTRNNIEQMWELYNYIRTDEEIRDRLLPMIYEDDLMYKGVAFYILAGVLQRRVEVIDGYMKISKDIQEIKDIIIMKANDINNKIMKLGQHFVGAIDSMVASDTFVDGIKIVFLEE